MFELSSYLTYFIGLITVFAFVIWRKFTYWSRQGVKGPSYIDLGGFLGIHHDHTLKQLRKYGRIYGSYNFIGREIIVNEPDLLRDIFVKDFHIFPNHRHFNTGTSKVGKSLFFLPGNDDWKRTRSILSPAFTSGKLKAMMSHMSDISDEFVDNLVELEKTGQVIDMRKYVSAFVLEVISACAYGIRVDSINNTNHPLVVNAKKFIGFDINLSIVLSVLAPPLAKFLKLEFFDIEAMNYFDKLTNDIMKDRKNTNKNKITDKSKRRTDFIQLIMNSETKEDLGYDSKSDLDIIPEEETRRKLDKAKGTLSPDEMTAQGLVFFIAGYDTSSASISHAIYYLSQNKDCQQRLYEELQTLTDFSYESLNQLKYLNAVISETLRLAPSVTRIQRECVKDYKLGNTGITIPAGTTVEIFAYALHRDPDFWSDPEEFKPERFLEATHHPYAYIPFGGGPRLCIGQRFALNEMLMCIAKLVNKFEISLAEDFKMEYFKGNVLITPKKLLVSLKARKQNDLA